MTYGTLNVNKVAGSGGGSISPDSSVFRNRIINGAMVIDQRNAGAAITPAVAGYTVDRWAWSGSAGSRLTFQQNYGSVTPPAGFRNYLGVFTASAYTTGAGEYFNLYQKIEGFNVSDLNWGTANAQTVTLSFWARSSLTGTFSGALLNSASTRSYPFSYTISAANTWEFKTITIAGDTTGTWLTNNDTGIYLSLDLGSGSTFRGTAGSWTGSAIYAVTGSVNLIGNASATFYITGVQLEVGTTATSFDYRPYGTELALCQRYYEIGDGPSFVVVSNVTGVFPNKAFSVTKRASSTVTISPAGGTGAAVTSGIAGFYQSTNHSGNSQTSWTASAEL